MRDADPARPGNSWHMNDDSGDDRGEIVMQDASVTTAMRSRTRGGDRAAARLAFVILPGGRKLAYSRQREAPAARCRLNFSMRNNRAATSPLIEGFRLAIDDLGAG